MPFVFLIVGLMLIVIGARNQQGNAVTLLQSEFTGTNSFVEWLIAALIIGGLGYIKPLKPVSDAFLGLMILVMIIANQNSGGLFAQFEAALQNTSPTPDPPSSSATQTSAVGTTAGTTGLNTVMPQSLTQWAQSFQSSITNSFPASSGATVDYGSDLGGIFAATPATDDNYDT